MTKEKAQQIVDEIRTVLARHHAAIYGTCDAESIYGEIVIDDFPIVPGGWIKVEEQLTNEVREGVDRMPGPRKWYEVDGIAP
jgi:hypothetical protein